MKIRFAVMILSLACALPFSAAGGEGPRKTISLKELEVVVMAENPHIRAMEREVVMYRARVTSSDTLEDPRLRFALNNLPVRRPNFTDSDMTSKELGISQMIPLGGKLSIRRKKAILEYKIAVERLRAERLVILTLLRRAAYRVMAVRETRREVEYIREQIRLVVQGEIASASSGGGSVGGVLKADMEYIMSGEDLINLDAEEAAALSDLSALAGFEVHLEADRLPDTDFVLPESEAIHGIVLSSSPELAVLNFRTRARTRDLDLGKREYVPDLELSMSYMQRSKGDMGSRDDMISVMASINVPVWFRSKNEAVVDEARAAREGSAALGENARYTLFARADSILAAMKRARELHVLYEEKLIPRGRLAVETLIPRYATGKSDLMTLVDSIRMLYRFRKEEIMARSEYLSLHAELAALAGMEELP